MHKILHITPHLGGGIGTVLLSWLKFDSQNIHHIVTLDFANDRAIRFCKDNGIPLFSQIEPTKIIDKIKDFDIVIIHFWNHPLLYDFLIRHKIPESRVIFWSHVSGVEPPYIFNKKLFGMCEKFVFTTPISEKFVELSDKFTTILSTGDNTKFLELDKEPHESYIASYIGTVDYAKMHPAYIKTLSKTTADKIIIVGGDKEREISIGCDKRFIFTGKIGDVTSVLQKTDVFAYLLNPKHYGTAEQVIQEAMSCGIVPVVLNNPCEKALVKHMETGLVAENLDEYVSFINLLKEDIPLRNRLSKNAKKYAIKNFSITNLANIWNCLFDDVMNLPKTEKEWSKCSKNLTSYDIFLESLGDFSSIFKDKTDEQIEEVLKQTSWQSSSKGTPKQYFKFLKGEKLEHICSLYI